MSCDLAGPTDFHMLLGTPKVFLLPLAIPSMGGRFLTPSLQRRILGPTSVPGQVDALSVSLDEQSELRRGRGVCPSGLLCGAAEEVNNVFFLPLCTLS